MRVLDEERCRVSMLTGLCCHSGWQRLCWHGETGLCVTVEIERIFGVVRSHARILGMRASENVLRLCARER